MENMFEYATRNKLRFESRVGLVTAEDLWDLPLTSRNGASLDDTAKTINRDLKAETEESFVTTTRNTRKKLLETKLDIVKRVISVKMAEAEKARNRAANAQERAKLLEILEKKETENLASMDEDAIRARLVELDT